MAFNQFSRNLENVTDPTDWQKTQLPELSQLDGLLRCFVCKEFFRAPVITGCNHTFCSQCIRECLVSDSHCPLCGSEQYESNLKKNAQLEEVAVCFSKLRANLLRLIPPNKESPKNNQNGTRNVVIEISSDDEYNHDTNLKSVSEKAAMPTRDEVVQCPICSKMMSANRLQTSHIDNCLASSSMASEPHDNNNNSDNNNHNNDNDNNINNNKRSSSSVISISNNKKRKSGISSFFSSQNVSRSSSIESKSKLVGPDGSYQKEIAKGNGQDNIKKLPKLDFSSLNTPRLKEKLSNINLPTTGTRLQLELRYNQYYILFNSNLDSNHPVSEKVLKQRLNQWELSHSAFTNNSNGESLFNRASNMSMKNINDKNFSSKSWYECYKKEFKILTKLAKLSNAKKKQEEQINGDSNIKEKEVLDNKEN